MGRMTATDRRILYLLGSVACAPYLDAYDVWYFTIQPKKALRRGGLLSYSARDIAVAIEHFLNDAARPVKKRKR